MSAAIILVVAGTIVITGLLTAMLYRMNAPKGMQSRDDGASAHTPIIAAGRRADRDDADDGSADAGGGDASGGDGGGGSDGGGGGD